jgi:hypothetical protein
MEQQTAPQTEPTVAKEARSWNDGKEGRPAAPGKVTPVVREKSRAEKWREARPSKMVVLGLMVATAILTMMIGFRWGGWVTGGTSLKNVSTGSQDAVTLRLAPICVAQSSLDPEIATKLVEFKAVASSRDRTNYVKDQGWSTMPGETASDSRVADACAKLLMGN